MVAGAWRLLCVLPAGSKANVISTARGGTDTRQTICHPLPLHLPKEAGIALSGCLLGRDAVPY